MPEKPSKRLRRPTAQMLDYLKTRIWFYELSRAAGYQTAYGIWVLVDGNKGSSKTWARYRDGKRVPGRYGAHDPVARANAIWPKTGQIFWSPIWAVLKGVPISNDTVINAIGDLGDEMKIILLSGGFSNFEGGAQGSNNIDRIFAQLALFPTLDSLQALILMLAWADNLGHPDLWNNVCGFYRHMIPELIDRGSIPFHEDFFATVDQIARRREFPGINIRVDVFEPWTDQLPRFDAMQAEKARMAQDYWGSMPKLLRG